jgi:DNA-binding transcriptional ArsR family regulator
MRPADISTHEPLIHEAATMLKALSHPERLKICCALRDTELSVGEIESQLNIDQPRLSRELAKLRELDLVSTRRESKMVFYTVNVKSKVGALLDAICSVMQS